VESKFDMTVDMTAAEVEEKKPELEKAIQNSGIRGSVSVAAKSSRRLLSPVVSTTVEVTVLTDDSGSESITQSLADSNFPATLATEISATTGQTVSITVLSNAPSTSEYTVDYTCDGDWQTYCNSYIDLIDAICGGDPCTHDHEATCEQHFLSHGQAEIEGGFRKAPNCLEFSSSSICSGATSFEAALKYCNSYIDFMDTICAGVQCQSDLDAIKCIHHYSDHGMDEISDGVRPAPNCGQSVPNTICGGNSLDYCNFYPDIAALLCSGTCNSNPLHLIKCSNHYWNNGKSEIEAFTRPTPC